MKLLSSSVALAVLLAGSGCSSSAVDPTGAVRQDNGPVATVDVGDTFALRVGETVLVRGAEIRITFLRVPEDSRCPQNVQCVWEGNARLELAMSQGSALATVSINTTLEPRVATFGGHRLELVELRPQKGAQEPLSQSEYVARLKLVHAS